MDLRPLGRQFAQAWDRHIFARMVLPLAPGFVMLQAKGWAALTPELLASLGLVLGLRLYADQPFEKQPFVTFVLAGLPVVEGALICSGVQLIGLQTILGVERLSLAKVTYGLAAIGTFSAAVSDARARK
jgi:hypothetical protein